MMDDYTKDLVFAGALSFLGGYSIGRKEELELRRLETAELNAGSADKDERLRSAMRKGCENNRLYFPAFVSLGYGLLGTSLGYRDLGPMVVGGFAAYMGVATGTFVTRMFPGKTEKHGSLEARLSDDGRKADKC